MLDIFYICSFVVRAIFNCVVFLWLDYCIRSRCHWKFWCFQCCPFLVIVNEFLDLGAIIISRLCTSKVTLLMHLCIVQVISQWQYHKGCEIWLSCRYFLAFSRLFCPSPPLFYLESWVTWILSVFLKSLSGPFVLNTHLTTYGQTKVQK